MVRIKTEYLDINAFYVEPKFRNELIIKLKENNLTEYIGVGMFGIGFMNYSEKAKAYKIYEEIVKEDDHTNK